MVAIIGVLAAVAIPAYQKYQETAKVNVIKGSMNQIIKAFNACLAVEVITTCSGNDINGTLKQQPNAAIAAVAMGTGSTNETCFTVVGAGSLANYGGCVAFDKDGTVAYQTSEALIQDTAMATSCVAGTGVCTN